MVSLLRDERIKDFDVIAIQEPWRNNFINTTHYPYGQFFDLAYLDHPETRTCFLINKRIARTRWTAVLHSLDLSTLTLETTKGGDAEPIYIYNVYNLTTNTRETTVPLLREVLTQPTQGNHIVLGDFNLHHPY